MVWKDIHHRLLDGLHQEIRANYGRIGKVEDGLGIKRGYLSELCNGTFTFNLPLFLRALNGLGTDIHQFFARVLATHPRPEDYLQQVETRGKRGAVFNGVLHAIQEVETGELPPVHPEATATAADVENLAGRTRRNQTIALRSAPKWRSHELSVPTWNISTRCDTTTRSSPVVWRGR